MKEKRSRMQEGKGRGELRWDSFSREVNENDFIVLISERLPCYLIVKRRRESERERAEE